MTQTTTLPSGGVITRGYNALTGQLDSLAGPGSLLLSYGYDGRLQTQIVYSGPVSAAINRTYDANYFLVEESVTGAAPVSYGHDDDGLLISAAP